MATRSLGRLTLDLVAQIGGFEAGMDKAARKSRSTMRSIEKHVNAAAKVLGGLGIAAGAGTLALVRSSAQAAQELDNLTQVANSSHREMQVLAYAGRDLGLSQEKIADVLKDVNDRVGDFLTTGAGPMADFFEKVAPQVGVTAEQFRNLSGPQSLQLFISSLEDANLNQQEMTFYMEQIASDATALLPLFRENGRELDRYARKAEELGIILSETEVEGLVDVSRQMEELGMVMDVTGKRIAAGAAPAIEDLMDLLQDEQTIQSLQQLGNAMVTVFTEVTNAISETVQFARWAGEEVARIAHGVSRDDLVGIEEQIEEIEAMLEGGLVATGNRIRFFGKDGFVEYYDDQELKEALRELKARRDELYRDMERGGPLFSAELPEAPSAPSAGASSGAQSRFNPYAAVPKTLEDYIDRQSELNKLVDDYLASSAETVALMGQESEVAQVTYQIEQGRFAGLASDRQQALVDAAARIDAAREEQRAQEQLLEQHRESMELASEYRRMALTDEQRALQDLKAEYAEIRNLVAEGYLSPEEGRAATEQIKEDFQGLVDSTKDASDELSQFAERAAENMQDAFADYLFDPFESGLDGMMEEFGRLLQRMAAEAAAAQIFDAIGSWGNANSGNDDWTGLVAQFAGFFDAGGRIPSGGWGVVGERGPEVVHGPANVIGREATQGLMAASRGGINMGNINMNFPGVGNAREADAAAGAAGRRLMSTINQAQRYR